MSSAFFTCPRCLLTEPLRSDLQFCPRCGLAGAKEAWLDDSPMEVAVGRRTYRVMDRIAVGSVCTIYRCAAGEGTGAAVFKVARDSCSNALILNEAAILRKLHASTDSQRFQPFVPIVADTLALGDEAGTRQASVLRLHEEIRWPEELYTLGEVRSRYSRGLDPRHVAWIWRRLLTVLGFAHSNDVIHTAVLPMHVLIEPREHKLVLIDWCTAVLGTTGNHPVRIIAGGYTSWYKAQGAVRTPPTPQLDVGLGARCMIELAGGDPIAGTFPKEMDPSLARYFGRCLSRDGDSALTAWKLLDDFDRLIVALWGRRKFVPLELPPKTLK